MFWNTDTTADPPAKSEGDETAIEESSEAAPLTLDEVPPLDEIPLHVDQHPAVQKVRQQERGARNKVENLREKRKQLEVQANTTREEAGRLEVLAEVGEAPQVDAEKAVQAEKETEARIREVERQLSRREAALDAFEKRLESARTLAAREISRALQPHIRARYQRLAELVSEASRIYGEFYPIARRIWDRRLTAGFSQQERIQFPHRLHGFSQLHPKGKASHFLKQLKRDGYDVEIPDKPHLPR